MKLSSILFSILLCMTSQVSHAALINEMQTCQGLFDFIDTKLNSASAKYAAGDVQIVRKGLAGYDQYIQSTIVSPGLLQFTGGDQAKSNQMQTQVDTYKKNVVSRLQKRYPQNRLFYDHVVSVNECAKQAVPAGQALEDLKLAMNTMIELAKIE